MIFEIHKCREFLAKLTDSETFKEDWISITICNQTDIIIKLDLFHINQYS
jgi:hypothetical protein